MKVNLRIAASAFALTALIAFGNAAMHATTPASPGKAQVAFAPLPPDGNNAQMNAALPEDMTITPDTQRASVVALPGGAYLENAVYITVKTKKVEPGLLTAGITKKNFAADSHANVAPAPDIANAAFNNTDNATAHALAPTTAIATAGTFNAHTESLNSATALATSPRTEVAAANINPDNEEHGIASAGTSNIAAATVAISPHLAVAATNGNRANEAGSNSEEAANIDQSDHGASAILSAALNEHANNNTAAIAVS